MNLIFQAKQILCTSTYFKEAEGSTNYQSDLPEMFRHDLLTFKRLFRKKNIFRFFSIFLFLYTELEFFFKRTSIQSKHALDNPALLICSLIHFNVFSYQVVYIAHVRAKHHHIRV